MRTVVFGMGRVGRATYNRLYADGETGVLGIDSDASKVEALAERGFNILEADATDQEFWDRLDAVHATKAVLAMSDPGANVRILEWLNRSDFEGRVIAVATYDDEADALRRAGVDAVINLYDGLGDALARAVEKLPETTPSEELPAPPSAARPSTAPSEGESREAELPAAPRADAPAG